MSSRPSWGPEPPAPASPWGSEGRCPLPLAIWPNQSLGSGCPARVTRPWAVRGLRAAGGGCSQHLLGPTCRPELSRHRRRRQPSSCFSCFLASWGALGEGPTGLRGRARDTYATFPSCRESPCLLSEPEREPSREPRRGRPLPWLCTGDRASLYSPDSVLRSVGSTSFVDEETEAQEGPFVSGGQPGLGLGNRGSRAP